METWPLWEWFTVAHGDRFDEYFNDSTQTLKRIVNKL